jgi:small redox-active disulfide protein 2
MTTMTQDDHTRIRVGEDQVGVMGLIGAMQEIAQSHGYKTDEEIQQALLERLSSKNYIPRSARDEYGRAFVREFRKSLGQQCDDVDAKGLSIVVLGPGCSQCNRLEQLVMRVLGELGLGASLEHVTDIREIANYGFVSTPALVINGKIVAMGTLPSAKKVKEWLTASSA